MIPDYGLPARGRPRRSDVRVLGVGPVGLVHGFPLHRGLPPTLSLPPNFRPEPPAASPAAATIPVTVTPCHWHRAAGTVPPTPATGIRVNRHVPTHDRTIHVSACFNVRAGRFVPASEVTRLDSPSPDSPLGCRPKAVCAKGRPPSRSPQAPLPTSTTS